MKVDVYRCLQISRDSNKHRQISYLGVSATLVDSNFHCYTIDPFCRSFESSEKSSDNVLIAYLRRNFKEWTVVFSFF